MGTIIIRVLVLYLQGVAAIKLWGIDKKDYLIPPFALFFIYHIFSSTLPLPSISKQVFFNGSVISWVGVVLCLAGTLISILALISIRGSFRIGIDTETAQKLQINGIFSLSRNPIYVSYAVMLTGQLLVFPNWIMVICFIATLWLFHRQVLREEVFLKKYYGGEFLQYCKRVRRYI
jgi:protein-S-isoprenylcysteine O-methyltransferase Ste14